jgi:transposase InsO family protein
VRNSLETIHVDVTRSGDYFLYHHRRLTRNRIRIEFAEINPYHNAWTESFMATLKNEMLQGGTFSTEADARIEIFDFIESYYNHHRKHSALGYQTPAQFEVKTQPNN